jgi:hypothetical protein
VLRGGLGWWGCLLRCRQLQPLHAQRALAAAREKQAMQTQTQPARVTFEAKALEDLQQAQ